MSTGALFAACGGGAQDRDSALENTASALGGSDILQATVSEHFDAAGKRFDIGEARSAGEVVGLSDFTYDLLHRLGRDQLRLALTITGEFLLPFNLSYTEVIDGRAGYIQGVSSIFDPASDPRPLPFAQITTRLKHTTSTSLLDLLHRALASPELVTLEADVSEGGARYHVLALAAEDHPPLRLFIDADTLLPAKLETVEHTPPLGDTPVEVEFRDYRRAGGLRLPHAVTVRLDGLVVQEETRSAIGFDVNDDDGLYDVPTELRRPFESVGNQGWISAQYLQTFEFFGLPILYDLDPRAEIMFTFVELAPGVFHVQAPTHNVLVVEMADQLVLVDAPLNEGYAEQLRSALAERWPEKRVRTVIATHFHFDHVGGVRNFGADGGLTLVTGADSVEFYERVFANPYTIVPDRYASNPQAVTIRAVEGSTSVSDGTRTVEVHRVATVHAADMVIVYLPVEGILFNSDLWSPEQGPLVGYFRVGATDLQTAASELGLPLETTVVGAHSPAAGTLTRLAELLAAP